MNQKKSIKKILQTQSKKIIIIPHVKADADALGSCIALKLFLRYMGHQAVVISPSDYPGFLEWMPTEKETIIFSDETQQTIKNHFLDSDILFCVDFSTITRSRDIEPLITSFKGVKVVIDHHMNKDGIFDLEFWNPQAAATAELIYELVGYIDKTQLKNKDIISCLYAGIVTDTGSFKYRTTSIKTHNIVIEMKKNELDTTSIHRMIFDCNTFEKLQLLGYALMKIVLLKEYKTAYISLSRKELQKFNYRTGDTEGIVNYALSIEGVNLACIFMEIPRGTRISFRSQGHFSVSTFSSKYFAGGGHPNSAGGILSTSLTDTVEKFLDVLPNYKQELNY